MSVHIVVVAVALEAAEVGDVGVGGGLALQLGLRLLLGRVDLALAGAFVEREGDLQLRAGAVDLQGDGVTGLLLGQRRAQVGEGADLAVFKLQDDVARLQPGGLRASCPRSR